MSQEQVHQFKSVTGATDAQCKKFLGDARGDLQRAITMYFDAGLQAATPPPPPPPPVVAARSRRSVVDEEDSGKDGSVFKLVAKGERKGGILSGVHVFAKVEDLVAEVTLTMRFVNRSAKPMEAVFVFRSEEASVCGFSAIVGGRRLKGVVQEKQEAKRTYDNAIAAGDGAFLLKQGAGEGSLSVSLGSLLPDEEARIELRYVQELSVSESVVTLRLPITRVPVRESTLDAGVEPSAENVEGVSVLVEAVSPVGISGLRCNTHEGLVTTQASPKFATAQFRDAYATDGTRKEMELEILVGEKNEPRLAFEKGVGDEPPAAMLTFVPSLPTDAMSDGEPVELIFLVDRSGSMSGGRIQQARNALSLFLRSIPTTARFNIVGFGSRYENLFPSSVAYDDRSLARATQHVDKMTANLSGTNILPPLRAILTAAPDPEFTRNVFVLTDGEVQDTEAVLGLVREHAAHTRVFTFGIGADASRQLVRGMATAGRGFAEFVGSEERLEAKVMRALARALQPVLRNARIEWGPLLTARDEPAPGLTISPTPLPSVFSGQPLIVYAFGGLPAAHAEGEIQLCGELSSGPFTARLRVEANDVGEAFEGSIIHKLAARSRLRDIEMAERAASSADNKKEAVALATRYSLLTAFTSFVVVAERDEAPGERAEMVEVDPAEAALQASRAAAAPQHHVAASLPRRKHAVRGGRGGSRAAAAGDSDEAAAPMRTMRRDMDARMAVQDAELEQISRGVDRLKEVAHEMNLDLDRQGELSIDACIDHSDSLAAQAQTFSKRSRAPNRGVGSAISGAISKAWNALPSLPRKTSPPPPGAAPSSSAPRQSSPRSTAAPPADGRDGRSYSTSPPTRASPPAAKGACGRGPPPRAAYAYGASESASSASDEEAGDAGDDDADGDDDKVLSACAVGAAAIRAAAGPRDMKKGEKAKEKEKERKGRGRKNKADVADDASDHEPAVETTVDRALLDDPKLRPIDRFVRLQKANGGWQLSATLAALIGVPLASLQLDSPASLGIDTVAKATLELIWGTALAIAYIETALQADQAEWDLLVKKARRFVAKELASAAPGAAAEGLLAAARSRLTSV